MKIARLPDGTRLAFDDDAPQSEIDGAVRRYLDATRSEKSAASIVVNVPEIKIPDSPKIEVEVTTPSSPELEKAISALGTAVTEMKGLGSAIEKLCTMVERSNTATQSEVRSVMTAVVTQMKSSSDTIASSAKELRLTLEKDKVFSFDTSGNPTRISVEK